MKKVLIGALCLSGSLLWHSSSVAAGTEIQLEIPAIETAQYHRPYVAIWVENEQQQPVKLITIWQEKPDWLKDLRRFWRKIGRSNPQLVDAMTGATRRPGSYTLIWDGKDDKGADLPAGTYTLLVEAAREQGGRSLQKLDFALPGNGQVLEVAAESELGALKLTVR
ncbi:DUF2271 domain-containing protein [Chromatiaceae bacterium AAb-1]|nr:DUF2271 domain-containing protein [Chromatiaceae bacterium AAb-1]